MYKTSGGCPSDTIRKIYKISSPTSLTFGSGFKENYNWGGEEVKLNALPTGGSYYSGTLSTRFDKTAYYLTPHSSVVDNNQKLTYSYTNNAGCISSISSTVNIIKTYGYIFTGNADNTLDTVCISDDAFTLKVKNVSNINTVPNEMFYCSNCNSSESFIYTGAGNEATFNSKLAGHGLKTVIYEYDGDDSDHTRFKISKNIYVDSIGDLTLDMGKSYCYGSELNTIKASSKTEGRGNIYLEDANPKDGFVNNKFSASFYTNKLIDNGYLKYGEPKNVIFELESYYLCKKNITSTIVIHETPRTGIKVPDICFNDQKPIIIYDTTASLVHDTINKWIWDFGDRTIDTILVYSDTISHNYSGTGQKTIKLKQETNYCPGISADVTINLGLKPTSEFSWVDECAGRDNAKKLIQFTDKSTEPDLDPIKNRYWRVVTENGTPQDWISTNNTTQSISFNESGDYKVQLKVVTKNNCIDTTTKIFHLRPWVTLADDMPYSENFENGNNGWYPSLSGSIDNTIWKLGESETFGTPEGERKVWYTENAGLYNINASVTGPCMDFSWIKKPMIKLNIKKSMLQGYDGAVLQYNTTDTIWNNLGAVSEGINWYNSNSIEGQPGNTFVGWTGTNTENEYVSAMLNLDNLKSLPYVRLRMAYGKKNSGAQGVAFDNVWIGNRSKVLMVEGFTSSSLTDDPGNSLNSYNGFDMLEMRYHTEGDDFYEQYSSGPNARSLYYKLSEFPAYIADGRIVYVQNSDTLSKKILQASKFDIVLKTERNNAGIALKATITPLTTIDAEAINLHVAVVEDSATIVGSKVVYRNVVRKLLPDPSGTRITQWQTGVAQEYDFSWLYYAGINPDKVKIIAFIQDSKTKEIYQAATDDAVFNKTGVNEINTLPGAISLYPNPANNYVYLLLNQASQKQCAVQVFNNMGMLVDRANISPLSQMMQLNTQNYKNGVYFIKVIGPDKVYKTGKLIVTHK